MMMIKRILLGLGGTRYTPVAIRRAVELATQNRAEITAVTAVDLKRIMQSVADADPVKSRDRQNARMAVIKQRMEESISDFEAECRRASIKHNVQWELGDPFNRMAELTRFHDLMIFGLRSLFDYNFGVEPKAALARLVTNHVYPVLAVSDRYRTIRRVLLTYSGSPPSAAAIKRFVQLRLWPEATARVVTFADSIDRAERLATEAADYCRTYKVPADVHCGTGEADHLIVQHAIEWEADLVVLGSSTEKLARQDTWDDDEDVPPGVLQRQVIGPTALHLMQHANRGLFLSQ